jgi:uncharacterized protein YecE (DUF72 family)
MGKVFIGTSGWVYEDWQEKFYPTDLKSEECLEYYSKRFNSVEINSTFYHLPRQKTFENWHDKTPDEFAFSAKLIKYITQNLKLKNATEPLANFLQSAKHLENKLSVVLVQLPPNFAKNNERLKDFLKLTRKPQAKTRWAFEFRHESWLEQETFDILRRFDAGFVIQDSAGRWPTEEIVTSDFVYLRFHGPGELYSSSYSEEMLKRWAEKIAKRSSQRLDVYAYFNSDVNAYAPANAIKLKEILAK